MIRTMFVSFAGFVVLAGRLVDGNEKCGPLVTTAR